MYMGYSRPNSAATFFSASSMRLRFSGREKSMNGSFTNSETCGFVSAVAIVSLLSELSILLRCSQERQGFATQTARVPGADIGASWGAAVLRPYEASGPPKRGGQLGLRSRTLAANSSAVAG